MTLRADHDPAAAKELSALAVALGGSLGGIDLEMLALVYESCALADQGKIAEGMHCLDEAAAAAVAGEMSNLYAPSVVLEIVSGQTREQRGAVPVALYSSPNSSIRPSLRAT